jgi:hypothetical protein
MIGCPSRFTVLHPLFHIDTFCPSCSINPSSHLRCSLHLVCDVGKCAEHIFLHHKLNPRAAPPRDILYGNDSASLTTILRLEAGQHIRTLLNYIYAFAMLMSLRNREVSYDDTY